MDQNDLGELARLDAREVWKSEPYDFTPWLRQNIGLLGEALGLEIDADVQQEVAVGLFSADLVGYDPSSSAAILIENQLEQTDHSHLGQLLTYAGGLDARILVWVSTKVREEHRQALTWLNENTHEDVLLFGVEIELLRIDDSRPAPHFRVVVEPNEWQKTQSRPSGSGANAGAAVSERSIRYRTFWANLVAVIKERQPAFTSMSPERASRLNWCAFSAGRTGFLDSLAFGWEDGGSYLRAEIYIDTGDKQVNKAAFDQLAADRVEIDAQFPEPLLWTRRDDIRASRIYARRPGSLDDSPEELDAHLEWFVKHAFLIRSVFGPKLKALVLEQAFTPERRSPHLPPPPTTPDSSE